MKKQRIIIPISFSFSIRYIIRTGMLDDISKFATPVIVFTWNERALIAELKAKNFEVYIMPEQKRGEFYRLVMQKLDFFHYNYTLKSKSRKIEEKYLSQYKTFKNKLRNSLRILKLRLKFLPSFYKNYLLKQEKFYLINDTNYAFFVEWLADKKADAVFTLTPFHTQEDLLLRAARDSGCKMITSILSFDNLTKRNRIPVEYDIYMVWNKYNYEELLMAYSFAESKKFL